jgi:hypothetical protein
MKRIYDFSSFNKIYEAEEGSEKPYENLLKQILSYLNTSYMSQIKLAKDPYDSKIMGDLDLIIKTPGVDSYKKILANIKAAVDTNSPEAKAASDAWSSSGDKFVNALAKLIEKLPNDKDNINKIITDFLNLQKQNLQQASKENKLKESYSYEPLNEGLFKTKKGLLDKLAKEVTLNTALLKNYESIPGMKDTVATQKGKINGIISKLASKKVDDMEKDELEKDLELIASIPTEISKRSEDFAKEDNANKEAAAIFVDAIKSLDDATEKDKAFVDKVKVEGEKDKSTEDQIKKDLGFKGKTIKKEEVGKSKNETISKIQKAIISSFKNVIKDSEVFKKFSEGKYAGDGFFGDNTAKVIKGLKAGFGIKDDTSDITQELVDKIAAYQNQNSKGGKTNESLDLGRISSFDSFDSIDEKEKVNFDAEAFKKSIGEKSTEKKILTFDSLKKTLDDIVKTGYEKNKEVIDYMLSDDFQPSEKGLDNFRTTFRTSWDVFKKYDEQKKKNTLAKGFHDVIEPAVGSGNKITKEDIDSFLKQKS